MSCTLKEQKDREDAQILEMWLACYTEQEIAKQLGISQQTVSDRLTVLPEDFQGKHSVKLDFQDDFAVALRLPELQESFRGKNLAKLLFQDDFEAPLYNVWKQQEKSNQVHHFGNSEA